MGWCCNSGIDIRAPEVEGLRATRLPMVLRTVLHFLSAVRPTEVTTFEPDALV
jgi:hypothetical protein